MSSPRSAPPLTLDVRPSRQLAALLLAVHGGATLLLPTLPLPWPVLIALALMLAVSWRECRRAMARRLLVWSSEGQWLGDNDERLELSGESFVSPLLTVVGLRSADGREQPLVLLPDSLDPHTYRRLRVRLRLEGGLGQAQ